MCNKKSPPPPPPDHGDHVQRSSMINKAVKHEDIDEDEEEEPTLQALKIAARKSRTKTRKPKFLSLRSKLIDENGTMMTAAKPNSHRHQLNLFPLNPENLVGDDPQDRGGDMPDENVELFFHSDGGATLNGLLTSATTTSTATTSTTMSSELEEVCLPPYAYYRGSISAQDRYRESGGDIVRSAMRSREREASVEKWVSYSELVDRKEETCSTAGDRNIIKNQRWNCSGGSKAVNGEGLALALALKLDYQEILDAWSDKGPLYIDGGDSPQIVPDLLHHHNQDSQSFQLPDNTFTVPEDDGSLKIRQVQREASVLRYKEKRQSRLFSKRIRYQVRKLNAEKRPRMKGRFVKRGGSKSNSIEE